MALRASTERTGDRGDGGWFEGVLRDGKAITWRCGHSHKTRDQSYPTRPSARGCAEAELRRRGMGSGGALYDVLYGREAEAGKGA